MLHRARVFFWGSREKGGGGLTPAETPLQTCTRGASAPRSGSESPIGARGVDNVRVFTSL